MDLSRPEALAALGLLPVLWWLARPPRPRRTIDTAHLPQWRAALLRLRRREVRFRRLRFWLLVAAFALTALAAAGPRVGAEPGPRVLAVVVDGSASMAAREPDGTTAFDAARQRVRAVLATLPAGIEVRVGVATIGGAAATAVLRGRAEQVAPRLDDLIPARDGGAVDLAAVARHAAADGVAVWTLTDARGPAVAVPDAGALDVVGAPDLANRAITRLEVDDRWPLPEVLFAVEVRTFPPQRELPPVRVDGGDAVAASSPRVQALEPGAWRVEFRCERRQGGRVAVRLDAAPGDAAAADDVASVVLPPPAAPRIGVLRAAADDDADWVGRAARLLAGAGAGRVVDAQQGERVDLLLVDGGSLEAPAARSLSFGTAFGSDLAPIAGPRVVDWDRRHPLTRGLDLSELVVRSAVAGAALPLGGTVLVAGDHGPLAVALEHDQGRSVHLGFRLEDSNLPLLAAFPQLLRRASLWIQRERIPERSVATADPAESDLRRVATAEPRRLPRLARPGTGLAAPLLLLALALIAGRAHVR